MLGKLLKHEWKSTLKLPLVLAFFIILMTILGCLSFRLPLWTEIASGSSSSFDFFDLLAILILVTYYISIIVAAFVFIIYFGVRFYKNLYTDEGYLMHTLPVTTRQLIVSKLLISALWNFLSSLLVFASMMALMYSCLTTLIPKEAWAEVSPILKQYLPEIAATFKNYAGISFTGFSIFFFFFTILSSFSGMAIIYVCISIGQLFKKHKVAASVVTYLVVTTLVQTITTIAILPTSFRFVNIATSSIMSNNPIEVAIAPFASMVPIFYFTAIASIIITVVCYFVSEYITKRNLNLD